jgi:hypothetical protein
MGYRILKYYNFPIHLNNNFEHIFKAFKLNQDYLTKNNQYVKKTNLYIRVYKDLLDLIPETLDNFWSGHTFPYLESEYELESSIALASLGFYKQAIACLRNVLELGLLSIYYNLEDKGHEEIQKWFHALEDTPFKKKIIAKIMTEKNIEKYSHKINVEEKINTLYHRLCNFSHTKGFKHSSRELIQSNINQFIEDTFILWLDLLKHTVQLIVELHLLKYPIGLQYTPMENKYGINGPIGGFLEPFQIERIKKIFDAQTFKILKTISDEDKETVYLANEINNLPDITEEDFKKQMLEQDKSHMKLMGYKNWLKSEKLILKGLKKESHEYKKMIENIENMKKWAKSEGLI